MSDNDRVHEILSDGVGAATHMIHDRFESLRSRCESPIEEILLARMITEDVTAGYWTNLQFFGRTFIFGEPHIFPGPSDDVWLQAMVADYRVDFLIDSVSVHGERSIVVVECDGHDFHERTKEQAQRDRRRDRLMLGLGIKVLRFTGSEIYNDSMAVWSEIETHLAQGPNFAAMRSPVAVAAAPPSVPAADRPRPKAPADSATGPAAYSE